MTLTKALKLLNKIDKGKISYYLQDCIDCEECNLGVKRNGKVYGLFEFYVDEAGESADEAIPLIDCRFWQKGNKGEITSASLTAGDILAKDWECVFVDCNCDLSCTIREYLEKEYDEIMYRDEVAKLDSRKLYNEGVKKVEIVDVLRDIVIIDYGIENQTGSALLNFESVAKTLKKDFPYIVVCHKANGDEYELDRVE